MTVDFFACAFCELAYPETDTVPDITGGIDQPIKHVRRCPVCLEVTDWCDPLEREPDFDFADYIEHCRTYELTLEWAEIDFLQWLYSDENGRMMGYVA